VAPTAGGPSLEALFADTRRSGDAADELLAGAFLAGNLPPDMVQPSAELVDQLQGLLPTVERLGLQRPPAALMERLATRLARSATGRGL
jgi:hypothetical protein